MERSYKRPKRQAVSLTSLLDLLFVMIFVSLIQQKAVSPTKEKPIEKVTQEKVQKQYFEIKATFNFYGTSSNPSLPSGKYIMTGSYKRKDGALNLGGLAWIERPPQYDMVPLSGKIDPETGSFRGRVEAIGCQEFTLERKLKREKTPISGEWVGTYSCSQGKTGLTLTIE
ncbi:MAG: hypothetical protein K9K67_01150 [Bacteriovoracaceae bacterium]|nr:hypothetical protein [Bacteriovoracaceae bacterium]